MTRPSVMVELSKWLRDESFSLEMLEWSWEKCMEFPLAVNPEEHKLEWTMYHKEYQKLFEDRADLFLQNEGIEADNLISEIARWQDEVGDTDEVFLGLVASMDYSDFVRYMQDGRRRREWVERTIMPNQDVVDWRQILLLAMQQHVDLTDDGDDDSPITQTPNNESPQTQPTRNLPRMACGAEEPEFID
eukprot:GEMP01055612.1.p1 GENE.GEMP01055612.1~~GEMP01055612.1.p1  ORF type:complete len:189 (+),score=44.09 GEMP01055612.1:158-724(+)